MYNIYKIFTFNDQDYESHNTSLLSESVKETVLIISIFKNEDPVEFEIIMHNQL